MAGVSWYLRSGKYLAETATEILIELKPPPQRLFADSAPTTGLTNYLRFQLSPSSAIALAVRVKRVGKEFVGDQQELYLLEEQPGAESPYERLLGDAMAGDGALFTREDAVEAAWKVVDPVLKVHHRVRPYKRHSWGRKKRTRSSLQMVAGTTPDRRSYRRSAKKRAVDMPPIVSMLVGHPAIAPPSVLIFHPDASQNDPSNSWPVSL